MHLLLHALSAGQNHKGVTVPGLPGLSAFGSSAPTLLIVGFGNPLAGDDSVGIELIRLLRNQREQLDCELLEFSQPGLNLLRFCERRGGIVFVDAVRSGSVPGTILLIPLPSPEIEPINVGSSHGVGLPQVLELCRVLARPLPPLMLLGIEIGVVKLGEPRSAEVERALQVVVSGFPALLRLLNHPTTSLWKQSHRYSPGDYIQITSAKTGTATEPSPHMP